MHYPLYTAPEMLIQESQDSDEKKGYTVAVDWWSLGITTFVLLNGTLPFAKNKVADLYKKPSKPSPILSPNLSSDVPSMELGSSTSEDVDGKSRHQFAQEFVRFLTVDENDTAMNSAKHNPGVTVIEAGIDRVFDISGKTGVSSDALSFITKLLTVDEKKRLGAGRHGGRHVRRHPFFKDINWNALMQKNVAPPYLPPTLIEEEEDPLCYDDFEDMMYDLEKMDWFDEIPSAQEQQYFANW